MRQITHQVQERHMLTTGHRQVPVERLSDEGDILLMPMDASVAFEESTCLVPVKCMGYPTCHGPIICAESCLLNSPADHDHNTFPANHHSVTFVGRPFPLEEAPEHFARLRRWGLSFSTSDKCFRICESNIGLFSSVSHHMGSG